LREKVVGEGTGHGDPFYLLESRSERREGGCPAPGHGGDGVGLLA
jgi:hypothetical protein